MRLTPLFLCLALLGPLLSLTPTAGAIDLAPYYNLYVGRTLMFLDFDRGPEGLFADEIFILTEVDLGQGYTGSLELDEPDWAPNEMTLWQVVGGQHYWAGQVFFDDGDGWLVFPPAGPVEGDMDVGEERSFWAYSYQDGEWAGPRQMVQVLMAAGFPFASVAGVFEDCVLVRSDMYREPGVLGMVAYEILAYGVGPVMTYSVDIEAGEPVPSDMSILVQIP